MSEMKWIPVTERLPEEGKDVLVQDSDGIMFVGWYDSNIGWADGEFTDLQVISWMPLPEKYKEAEALKPCPFCGCVPGNMRNIMGMYFVRCQKCYAETRSFTNRDEAVKFWNTRG